MCLIAIAYNVHPDLPLIVLANRDEFYERSTAPAAFYPEHPGVYAGRDLVAGGTWMGVAQHGRFAALTNFRDPTLHFDGALSRGKIVDGFLEGTMDATAYIEQIRPHRHRYNPFSLIVGDATSLLVYSSVNDQLTYLTPGIYALSNHLLDTPWPKVVRARQILAEHVLSRGIDPEAMIYGMQDPTRFDPKFLPATGISNEFEHALSALFIHSPTYGTRSTALLLYGRYGDVGYWELTYDTDGQPSLMSVLQLTEADFKHPTS